MSLSSRIGKRVQNVGVSVTIGPEIMHRDLARGIKPMLRHERVQSGARRVDDGLVTRDPAHYDTLASKRREGREKKNHTSPTPWAFPPSGWGESHVRGARKAREKKKPLCSPGPSARLAPHFPGLYSVGAWPCTSTSLRASGATTGAE